MPKKKKINKTTKFMFKIISFTLNFFTVKICIHNIIMKFILFDYN